MTLKTILGVACICISVLSTSANASVITNINGINYEWLDLSVTQGMSINEVQTILDVAGPGDLLYGYQYASRLQVEGLLTNYSSWDGLDGTHVNSDVLSGVQEFINDFGYTDYFLGDGVPDIIDPVDGDVIEVNATDLYSVAANYGLVDECWNQFTGCHMTVTLALDSTGPLFTYQSSTVGWNAQDSSPDPVPNDFSSATNSNLLVRLAVVPVPAAIWLFGSGLIGLIGLARRKSHI